MKKPNDKEMRKENLRTRRIPIVKWEEKVNLFLKGEVEAYGTSIVRECVPDGEYIDLLGVGGEKGVLLIYDPLARQKRVLQILLPDLVPEQNTRFFRSYALLCSIVQKELQAGRIPPFPVVYEARKYPPYVVSEYVDGVTLEDYIRVQGEEMGLLDRLILFRKLAVGLHMLHERGVVHRDVKPTNVMIANDGTPKWIDFGIALSQADNPLTRTGQALGTEDYMAPEQFKDAANVDRRADVYALAKLLFFIICGNQSWDPVELPPELIMVIPRALQDQPARRHQTVAELLEDVSEAYPDFNLLGGAALQENDMSVAEAFVELLVLFGGNVALVKKLVGASMGEWDYLMRNAKSHVLRQ